MFTPNRRFRRAYNRLFRKNPVGANIFFMLAELANEHGEIRLEAPSPEIEIQRLLAARFDDPRVHQMEGLKK
jgi:hypothetical protein